MYSFEAVLKYLQPTACKDFGTKENWQSSGNFQKCTYRSGPCFASRMHQKIHSRQMKEICRCKGDCQSEQSED